MNKEWKGNFESFDYFIQTSDAIIGVYYESDDVVKGRVVSSKPDIKKDQHITIDKDEVVEELYRDGIDIIERIPEWFYSEEGFSSV